MRKIIEITIDTIDAFQSELTEHIVSGMRNKHWVHYRQYAYEIGTWRILIHRLICISRFQRVDMFTSFGINTFFCIFIK